MKKKLIENEINVKRFYVPIILKRKCDTCNDTLYWNKNGHTYLSYPCSGDEQNICFICDNCLIEYNEKYIFNFYVECKKIDNEENNQKTS